MTTTKRAAVVGVFTDRTQAERAIQELERAGFSEKQIGFIRRDGGTDRDRPGKTDDKGASVATGAVSGGVLGGILGAAASLLIPGFGPAIAGGILAATLGGVAIGAAAGGIIGALTKMGVPEEEARYYQGELEAGRMLVTVRTADPQEQRKAMDILRQHGAYDAKTSPGATSANARPEYNPNAASGYDPNARPGYDPNARPEYNPNAAPGYDPNARPGYNPNAAPGYDPNARPRYDPDAGSGYDINARPGTYDPNTPGNPINPFGSPVRRDDNPPPANPLRP